MAAPLVRQRTFDPPGNGPYRIIGVANRVRIRTKQRSLLPGKRTGRYRTANGRLENWPGKNWISPNDGCCRIGPRALVLHGPTGSEPGSKYRFIQRHEVLLLLSIRNLDSSRP